MGDDGEGGIPIQQHRRGAKVVISLLEDPVASFALNGVIGPAQFQTHATSQSSDFGSIAARRNISRDDTRPAPHQGNIRQCPHRGFECARAETCARAPPAPVHLDFLGTAMPASLLAPRSHLCPQQLSDDPVLFYAPDPFPVPCHCQTALLGPLSCPPCNDSSAKCRHLRSNLIFSPLQPAVQSLPTDPARSKDAGSSRKKARGGSSCQAPGEGSGWPKIFIGLREKNPFIVCLMPEIAEVECARCLLERMCCSKRILNVQVVQDTKVFDGSLDGSLPDDFHRR